MNLYKLPIVLYEPSDDTNDMYMAEVPLLPGCRAWGDTPSMALECIQGVAEAFIESCAKRGVPLPVDLDALAYKTEAQMVNAEITIAPLR